MFVTHISKFNPQNNPMCWSLTGKAVVESGPVTQPNHCPTLLSYTIKGSEHYLYRNFMILAIVPDAQITYKAQR